jgi:hypothetical protein
VFTPVAGVPAAPPASGLVASAVRPNLDRWETGLAWSPERCGTEYRLVPVCDEPEIGYEASRPGAAYYQPVGAQFADECSTLGGPVDVDRVRRLVEAQTPFAIARELWTGELTQTDPYTVGGEQRTNAYLASPDADVVTGSGTDPVVAFGRLEQAALEATHGQPVMLHVPVMALGRLHDAFRNVGQQLVTHAGNVLVADAGYSGSGPAGQAPGAAVWAYATAPVAVLISPITLITDPDAVDRSTNTRTVSGSRVFAAAFDSCVHLATELTL